MHNRLHTGWAGTWLHAHIYWVYRNHKILPGKSQCLEDGSRRRTTLLGFSPKNWAVRALGEEAGNPDSRFPSTREVLNLQISDFPVQCSLPDRQQVRHYLVFSLAVFLEMSHCILHFMFIGWNKGAMGKFLPHWECRSKTTKSTACFFTGQHSSLWATHLLGPLLFLDLLYKGWPKLCISG